MTNLVHPVLMCGGSGTRLWPMLRKSYPKQFVKLTGEETFGNSIHVIPIRAEVVRPNFSIPRLDIISLDISES